MLDFQQGGWLVMAAAAAVVVLLVIVEWARYAFRSLRMAHLLAKSRKEELHAPRPSVPVRARVETPRAAVAPSMQRRVPIPPEIAIDIRE